MLWAKVCSLVFEFFDESNPGFDHSCRLECMLRPMHRTAPPFRRPVERQQGLEKIYLMGLITRVVCRTRPAMVISDQMDHEDILHLAYLW
ncbi:MAG: hypothetical protein IPO25_23270 [Saprospiraceae bacterium]|nr:hypothetical protein [Saprospiraceae bacterium]